MRVAEISTVFLSLALALGLTWSVTPVVWGDPDVCCPWPDYPDYGDGRDGNEVISEDTQLWEDMYYEDLTIQPGATLDTCGHTVRVCGTLTVLPDGIITDTCSGGAGGDGGGIGPDGGPGLGGDPMQHGNPPYCPHGAESCTDGQDGEAGDPPADTQPGENGYGGHGGGSDGGGGPAWWKRPITMVLYADADGGDGGAGGRGGKGGGYVEIYAFRFDNRGVIHADGYDAPQQPDDGAPEAAPNGYSNCGAEYTVWQYAPPFGPWRDVAGGGGGGGGGGFGGNGGTVQIYYADLEEQGTIRANGGEGASGGAGGAGGGCNIYDEDPPWAGYEQGCPGGSPGGGHGGRGAYDEGDCAADGTGGGDVSDVVNGTWSLTALRRYCKIGPDCYWADDLNPLNKCEECDPEDFSMTAWSCVPAGTDCDDGQFCNGDDTCDADCECIHEGDPCEPCDCYEGDPGCCQEEYLVGGQAYTICEEPIPSGLNGVEMCVTCDGEFIGCDYTHTVGYVDGMWEVDGAPCFPQVAGGDCTVTASSHPHRECCGVPPCPPISCDSSIEFVADEDHEVANQNLQHWCCCVYCDLNGDKVRTIIDDVPCFVDCVYYENCDCCDDCCLEAADANCDGHLSIIWDVIPFVDCVYHEICTPCAWNCPEEGACGSSGTGQGADGFTIGGAVYSDESSPLFTGVEGIPVRVVSRDSVVLPVSTPTNTTTNWLGIWRIDNLAPGTYTVVFGQEKAKTVKAQNSIKIVVNEKNQAANQSIKFLRKP